MEIMDMMIIGGGPAGLSAAVNARRRGKSVIVISKEEVSSKLWQAPHIENYLGIAGVSGKELAEKMKDHAAQQGVVFSRDEVQNLWREEESYIGMGRENQYSARSVILATGVLQGADIPGEESLIGKGVSYCATCDGMFYRNKPVAIIGYIPEAEEEARFLAGICSRVVFLPQYGVRRVVDPRVEVLKGKPREIIGENKVEGLRVGETLLQVTGVFIERPGVPMARFLPDLAMENGSILVDREMRTNLPGVYAAGDCIGRPWQIAKAVGEGQIAALSAVHYLENISEVEGSKASV
ncbi:MAG TPA: FAD-dependent oxidoreductase [Bacillota bacterium]|nr:FAD-dependent oxidoreductase [Bacillota bacterium]